MSASMDLNSTKKPLQDLGIDWVHVFGPLRENTHCVRIECRPRRRIELRTWCWDVTPESSARPLTLMILIVSCRLSMSPSIVIGMPDEVKIHLVSLNYCHLRSLQSEASLIPATSGE